ncbi:MAG: SusC/RagA family TonB-linked outer membrane protein [Bacteroidales bacterium]
MQRKFNLLFRASGKVKKGVKTICFYLLMTMLSSHTYASVWIEGITLIIREESISLIELIEELDKRSELEFVYNAAYLEKYQDLKINQEGSVKEVLQSVLKNTDLELTVSGDVYIVSPIKQIKGKGVQKKTVKGIVTDKSNLPLPGVNVIVKGTLIGTVTDLEGRYSIDLASDKNQTLVFSFMGMKPREVQYDGQSVIDVVLEDQENKLGEVVVTGYQTISKERSTGSYEIIDKEILEESIHSNVASKLEGVVAGLKVSPDGEINIRGISTFNGDRDVLLVVDGFPTEKMPESNDIESVTVLKDAAAASIWGARASNGVMVITTKRGTSKEKINVNASVEYYHETKEDESDYRNASPSDLVDLELDIFKAGWIKAYPKKYPKVYTPVWDVLLKSTHLKKGVDPREWMSPEEKSVINSYRNKDVQKEYYEKMRRARTWSKYSVSLDGHIDNINYYTSLNYTNTKSSFVGNEERKINANMRMDMMVFDDLKLVVGCAFENSDSDRESFEAFNYGYGSLKDNEGNYNSFYNALSQSYKDEYSVKPGYVDWNYNPLQQLDETGGTVDYNHYRAYLDAGYALTDALSINYKFQLEKSSTDNEFVYGKNSFEARNLSNTYTYEEDGQIKHDMPHSAILTQEKRFGSNLSSRIQLNYRKEFGKHTLTCLGGYEYRKEFSRRSNYVHFGYGEQSLAISPINLKGYVERTLNTWNNSKYNRTFYNKGPRMNESDFRYVSYFANLGYTFDEKYDFTASARIDDSNLFGASKKYRRLPLWSVGAGWTLSNEKFFSSEVVNYLKFRGSYGFNGNIDRSTIPQMKLKLGLNMLGGKEGAYIYNPENPKLRWEKTRISNLAIEFGLFDNKMRGSVEYYNKKSEDLLGNQNLHPATGYESIRTNVAKVSNKGVEVELNSLLFKSKDFEINAGINLSYNKNEVLENFVSVSRLYQVLGSGYYVNGAAMDARYVYRNAGLNENGEPLIYDVENNIQTEISDDPTSEVHLKLIKNTNAPYYGGLNLNIQYKNFSLRTKFTGEFGHYFKMPEIKYYSTSNLSVSGNTADKDVVNRWRKSGDEKFTNIPKIGAKTYSIEMDYYNDSDVLIRKADYVAFRELGLSYRLKSQIASKLKLQNLKLSFQVRNLGIWTRNKENLDPRRFKSFTNSSLYNPYKTNYSLGITAKF